MRMKKALVVIGALAAATLTLSACNSGSPGKTDAPAAEKAWKVAENVSLDGSPTFDKMKERGKVVVGVKEDQPNLGYLDNTTKKRSGFDIDIARWIAADLGFDEDKIDFRPIASANREQAIVNGDIDYYVGTYSINDKRKQEIDFAGPYFITGQGLLVRTDEKDFQSIDELEGKTVCSATGSTPIQNIKANYPKVKTQEFDLYSACVENLVNGQVDAVTTDQAILIGYAAQQPDKLKVTTGPLFSEEKYGVGLPKGDDVLRKHINDMFTNGGDTWKAIFKNNLGESGITVDQPAVDAY
ncbi:glutamate ABC transporter substrate-binding protein [Leucobacter sp. CSA2]|uniref:Glutamate ABC transporter substrate-binding protein n=1 Tax=Leucobacter edaphi TaxID=2796472 RepID=A0A934QBC9_9MICO|nr:glutamate ABC transporter substrate-binding protein [Leucobacter edaphi]MBK0421283.1 glutamate ABC transporter substrate-binding protein [Leucobacter edaphi]